jgi:hypothetical protein
MGILISVAAACQAGRGVLVAEDEMRDGGIYSIHA